MRVLGTGANTGKKSVKQLGMAMDEDEEDMFAVRCCWVWLRSTYVDQGPPTASAATAGPCSHQAAPSLQDMVVEDLDEDMEGAAAAPAPKPASGGHAGARRVLAWLNGLQRGCCSSWLQPDKAAALFASIDQSPAILCTQRKTWMRTTSRTRRRRCRPSEHSQPLRGLLC